MRRVTSAAWDWVPDWSTNHFGDDPISSAVGTVLFLIGLPFMVPALLVTPFFLLESALQWSCLPIALAARALGVLPVTVWVKENGSVVHTESVRGWARARARRDALAGRRRR